ncbi:MAG: cellulose binding domain-containing protein, partial [Fibrobacterota bacterium]
TIGYEKATDISWRKNALLPMEPSDASTPGYQLGEQIRANFLIPRGVASTRIYEEDYGVSPEITPCDISNVRAAWSSGRFGVNTWWTHGSETYAADIFSSYDATYLNDAYPSFTFQNSCTNGAPEWSNNLGYALLANGAIGTVSASRVSWYWVGQSDFTGTPLSNSMMAYAYTGALMYDTLPAGKALNQVRRAMDIDASWNAMNMVDFNLYGDPSLGITTSAPAQTVPTGLQATAGIRRVGLSWNAYAGALKYYIKRSVVGGALAIIDSTSLASYADTLSVGDNATYVYAVSAVTVGGQSGNSTTVQATTAPAAVVVKSVVPANRRLSLSWTRSPGATAFQIFLVRSADSIGVVGATQDTFYTLTGLVNDSAYKIVVAPLNAQGVRGAYSAQIVGIPSYTVDQVVGLVALSGDRRVDLSWRAVDGAEMYVVQRSQQGSATVFIDSTTTISYADTGRVNGTTYSYRVGAVKGALRGAYSETVLATPLVPAPIAPTGLVARGSIGSISLTWDTVRNATGYAIYRMSDTLVGFRLFGAASRTSYSDTTASPGTRYTYAVIATNGAGSSPMSASASAIALAPIPAAPTGIVVTAGDKKLTVSWSASSWASTYTVKTATVAGGPYVVSLAGATGGSATLTGLVNGSTYYVVVSAVNATGESPNSSEASGVPVAPPSGLKIQYKVGDNSATDNTIRPLLQIVNTSGAAVPLSDITIRYWYKNEQTKGQSYWCDWSPIGCANIVGNYKGLSVSVPGADGYMEIGFKTGTASLAAGASTEIQSRITRVDWSNHTETGDWSYDATKTAYADWANVTVYKAGALVWGKEPGVATPPGVPTQLAAFAGVNRDTVTWKAGVNNVSFNLYRSVAGAAKVKIYSGTSAIRIDTGLVAGTEYTYWVSGVNGALESALSDSVRVVPLAPPPPPTPGVPTQLAAFAGVNRDTVTWKAGVNNVSFNLYRSVAGAAKVKIYSGTSAIRIDTGLVAGTEYTYWVSGVNGALESALSDSVRVVPLAPPPPPTPGVPTQLAAFAGVNRDTVTWKAGVNNVSFNLYRSVAGAAKVKIYSGTSAIRIDTGLVAGTEYTYWVSGVNGALESALSDSVRVVPLAPPPPPTPGVPTQLAAFAGVNRDTVTWKAGVNNVSFNLYRSVAGAAKVKIYSGTSAIRIDTGLVAGTEYTYWVSGVNGALESALSDSVRVVPKSPTADLKIQYRAGSTMAASNSIQPYLQLVNTGKIAVSLSDVTIRYWFTNDGSAAVSYWCDWAQIGAANLTGTVKTASPARTGADRYLEISFKTSAGSLAAGASTGAIQSRFSKNDWSNFTQTNDASFDATKTAFADWNKVTVYRGGVLVWGVEP